MNFVCFSVVCSECWEGVCHVVCCPGCCELYKHTHVVETLVKTAWMSTLFFSDADQPIHLNEADYSPWKAKREKTLSNDHWNALNLVYPFQYS